MRKKEDTMSAIDRLFSMVIFLLIVAVAYCIQQAIVISRLKKRMKDAEVLEYERMRQLEKEMKDDFDEKMMTSFYPLLREYAYYIQHLLHIRNPRHPKSCEICQVAQIALYDNKHQA
jgi:hypothetical protein